MTEAIRSLQIIASQRMGGAEIMFQRLTRALDASGNPVQVGVRRGSAISRHFDARLPITEFSLRNYVDVGSIMQIRHAASAFEARVVQTWASRATWLTRTPPGAVHIARLGGFYKLRYFRHAHAWIVNSRGLRDWVVTHGFPADRVEWINNFVSELPAGTPPSMSRDILGIPADALVVMTMGRFVEKKGFQDLVQAFGRLPRDIGGRPVHLVMMGDGPLLADLRAATADFRGRLHFTGWLDQPLPVLGMADVFVCPSRIEPLGNVVLEAWSQGVPVVCTETAGGTELIRNGDTGLLCPAQDVVRMAGAIERVLTDSALRAGLAGNGRTHYRARYGERKTVEAMLDFYGRMMRGAV